MRIGETCWVLPIRLGRKILDKVCAFQLPRAIAVFVTFWHVAIGSSAAYVRVTFPHGTPQMEGCALAGHDLFLSVWFVSD